MIKGSQIYTYERKTRVWDLLLSDTIRETMPFGLKLGLPYCTLGDKRIEILNCRIDLGKAPRARIRPARCQHRPKLAPDGGQVAEGLYHDSS